MTNVVTSSGTVRRSVPVRVRADIPWNRGLHSAPNVRAARSTRLQVRPPRLGIVRSSRRRAANGQYPVGHRLVGHRNCSMRRPSVPSGPKEGDIGKALHAGLGGLIGLVIVLFLYSVIGLLPNSENEALDGQVRIAAGWQDDELDRQSALAYGHESAPSNHGAGRSRPGGGDPFWKSNRNPRLPHRSG